MSYELQRTETSYELMVEVERYYPGLVDDVKSSYLTASGELVLITKNRRMYEYQPRKKSMQLVDEGMYVTNAQMREEELREDFAANLRNMVEIKQITQSELADRTGIPMFIIGDYWCGERMPDMYRIRKLASALGCSVADLVDIE